MNTADILLNLDDAERCLCEARKAMQTGDDAALLRRLSLVAQYASLAAHHMPDTQPGVERMRGVWATANSACDESLRADRMIPA